MNESEFIDMVLWDKKKLWRVCNKITKKHGHVSALTILMKTRRNIQEALSKYSKGKAKIDWIQEKAVWMTEMIAKWCGQYYKGWAMKELIKNNSHLASQPQKLKGLTSKAWEEYLRKLSY